VTTDLPVDQRVTLPAAELDMQFSRSSGPGGQHVNTSDTRVQLRWSMAASQAISRAAKKRLRDAQPSWVTTDGDVLVTADGSRSRHRNIEDAREKLRDAVYRALRPPRKRKKTRPTRSSKRRRLKKKKARGRKKKLRGRVRRDDW